MYRRVGKPLSKPLGCSHNCALAVHCTIRIDAKRPGQSWMPAHKVPAVAFVAISDVVCVSIACMLSALRQTALNLQPESDSSITNNMMRMRYVCQRSSHASSSVCYDQVPPGSPPFQAPGSCRCVLIGLRRASEDFRPRALLPPIPPCVSINVTQCLIKAPDIAFSWAPSWAIYGRDVW